MGVTSYRQAEKVLLDQGALADLRERADAEPFTTTGLTASRGEAIVAGQAIDLSGRLDCLAWDCVETQVHNLFNRVWHYFDRIVIVGPSAHEISRAFEEKTRALDHLPTYVRLLLYLREIGAEKLLVFRQKRPPCQIHLKDHLREVGIEDVEDDVERAVPQFAKEGELSLRTHDDHIHYAFSHPQFEHTVWGSIPSDTKGDLSQALARSVVGRYLATLASDLYTARALKSPLGSTVRFHTKLLASNRPSTTDTGTLAFHLDLPTLHGVEVRTLLKIRSDETPAFEKFRRALVKAMEDGLANNKGANISEIANEIRRDVLEPALNDIELRLKRATGSLATKAASSIAISSLPTICGLYTATPLLYSSRYNTSCYYLDKCDP